MYSRSLIGICTTQEAFFIKSIAGRYRPVSYPDGPITARYRFIKNAIWELARTVNGHVKLRKTDTFLGQATLSLPPSPLGSKFFSFRGALCAEK